MNYLDLVYNLEITILKEYGQEPRKTINSYINNLDISKNEKNSLCIKIENY